ncbi:MAG: arylamine N-acetyltransferase [Eggerthellaceae bacterium]|nr:arylamine N-acetyltransferase [Eggerthellaceae bacterium]
MFTVPETEKYLHRIGYTGSVTPSIEALERLTVAHLRGVPFETIRLCRTGDVPDLSMDALYENVVDRNLGGYCFELNKLFYELLVTLGYKARPAFARSISREDSPQPINHRTTIVTLGDEVCMVDVGWGGPAPHGLLMLEDGVIQEVDGHKFIATAEGPDVGAGALPVQWRIERIDSKGERQGVMVLYTVDAEEEDFDMMNIICASPGSLFTDGEMANVLTSDGFKSYKDGVIKIQSANGKETIQLADDEVDGALKEHFRLDYTGR